MENLMQSYVQSDRDLAAANERLAEREFSMEKEIKRLREQLDQQQERQAATVEPKVRLRISLLFVRFNCVRRHQLNCQKCPHLSAPQLKWTHQRHSIFSQWLKIREYERHLLSFSFFHGFLFHRRRHFSSQMMDLMMNLRRKAVVMM
jgi:hypothetical protein